MAERDGPLAGQPWTVDEAGRPTGWLKSAQRIPSPNFNARSPGTVIDTLVIHHISLPAEHYAGPAIIQLFTNTLDVSAHASFEALAPLRVSAHFVIRRHGGLIQFVDTDQRAWHAGPSRLLDREACNEFSIGIELEGGMLRPFTPSQYRRLIALIRVLAARYPLRYCVGHSDIAPGRKTDPGPFFEWARLRPAMDTLALERPFR